VGRPTKSEQQLLNAKGQSRKGAKSSLASGLKSLKPLWMALRLCDFASLRYAVAFCRRATDEVSHGGSAALHLCAFA
jgi:hypothetical protein